ncbi:MAG: hypothetical protein ACREV5_07815 [Steroidobacter sp.]
MHSPLCAHIEGRPAPGSGHAGRPDSARLYHFISLLLPHARALVGARQM